MNYINAYPENYLLLILMFNCSCPYICCTICGIILVAFIILIIMCYLGICKKLKPKEGEILDSIVYYYDFIGNFYSISKGALTFTKIIGKIGKKELREQRCRYSIFYFDDPSIVEDMNQYRYSIGLFFDKRIVNEELDQQLIKCGLQKAELPKSKVLRTSFPFKNWISYYIGASKAWPMLYQKATDCKCNEVIDMKYGGCIEFCSFHKIQYFLPIENYEKFYITKAPPPKIKKEFLEKLKKKD